MEYVLSPESPRVLVVDDEKVIREIITDFMGMEGWQVTAVSDGEEAIKLLKEQNFEIVITDLKMPKVDGLQLLKKIKEMKKDLVPIMMTGYATVDTAIEAMKKGAYDYVLKPFKVEDLLMVAQRALEQQRLKRENIQLKEMLSLYKLSEAMSSKLPLDEQYDALLTITSKEADADVVQLIEVDQENPGEWQEVGRRVSENIEQGDGIDLGVPDFDRLYKAFEEGLPVLTSGNNINAYFKVFPSDPAPESYMALPLKASGRILAMLQVFSFTTGKKFYDGKRKLLTILVDRAAASIENTRLYEDLETTFKETIKSFAHALEAKDEYTSGHSDRVAAYSILIARGLGFDDKQVEDIRQAAILHDIGKLGMRFEDLNKPQKLTPEEYEQFKRHPVMGQMILEPISFLKEIVPMVYHHHEKYDGSGYPEGKKGEEIPLGARILAVADTYDAMTTNRPYRKALPHKVAIEELKRYAGTQFDPMIVGVFLIEIEKYRKLKKAKGEQVPD